MNWDRVFLAVLALLLAVLTLVGASFWLGDRLHGSAGSAVFPGGSRFQVLGMTVGNVQFTTEPHWRRVLRRVLPAQMQANLPGASMTSSSSGDSNSVTVWFEIRTSNGLISTAGSLPWSNFAAEDLDGFRYSLGGGYGSCSSGATKVWHITLSSFPRRQSEFDLVLLGGKGERLASVRLGNPVPGPFPQWQPAPLPITHTNAPLVVTLERVSWKTYGDSRYVQPQWKLQTDDPHWKKARPLYQTFRDATGNQGSFCSPKEPAWKLVLPFHRTEARDFDESEKFSVTNLASPAPGSLQRLDFTAERLGVKFKVLCLASAGALTITNATHFSMQPPTPGSSSSGYSTSTCDNDTTETWYCDQPFFLIETSEPGPLDDLRFRLTTADGRGIPVTDTGYHCMNGGGRKYQKKFQPPDDAGMLSLEIIVSRGRVFEFIFDPAEMKNASPTAP